MWRNNKYYAQTGSSALRARSGSNGSRRSGTFHVNKIRLQYRCTWVRVPLMAGIDLSCPTNPPLPLPAGGQLGAARGCGDLNAISQFMAFNFDHIPPRRIPQCAPTAPSARCPMPKSHPFVHRLATVVFLFLCSSSRRAIFRTVGPYL